MVKSLCSVGQYGAEVGGLPEHGMSLLILVLCVCGIGHCWLAVWSGRWRSTSGTTPLVLVVGKVRSAICDSGRTAWVGSLMNMAGVRKASVGFCSSFVLLWFLPCVFQLGHRRRRDLEERTRLALTPHTQLHWIKAHQTQQAIEDGRITMDDIHGNQEADIVSNLGSAEHDEPSDWLHWELHGQTRLASGWS
eukprot:5689257-Amphidinium_carterae.1